MRGKKAKMLRKMAQGLTVGMPDRDYVVNRALDGKGKPASQWWITGTNEDGTPQYTEIPCNTVSLVEDCTRAVYQKMKERV